MVFRTGAGGRVLLDPSPADFLNILQKRQIDARRIVDVAVGIGAGNDLRPHGLRLFDGIDGDIPRPGDGNRRALDGDAVIIQHILHKIEQAVARSLGARQAAAESQPLAGEDAFVVTREALILPVEVADFPSPDADIPRRNVHIGADVAGELSHEGLAKAHDLAVGFSLRVKVGAALAAAMGSVERAFFSTCSVARNFKMLRFTLG